MESKDIKLVKDDEEKGVFASYVHEIFDNLRNYITGLGTKQSKLSYNQWTYDYITDRTKYEACYLSSWIARRVVDVIPSDMCREWREIKCDNADEIRVEEDRVEVRKHFEDALRLRRLCGGSAIVMMTNQDLRKPLNVSKIRKGDLKNLVTLDRWLLYPSDTLTLDPLNQNFMNPEFYRLTMGNGGLEIHHSHIIRFTGLPVPPMMRIQFMGWGDSALRQAMPEIEAFTMAIRGIAESISEFNIDVISKEGLLNDLATGAEKAILARFQAFDLGKSTQHMALLDSTEKLERIALNYSGIEGILQKLMMAVSGASNTPMTKLFGDSAKGLNATGEGDDVNYFTYIRSLQSSKLDSTLRMFDEVLVRSALGYFPEDFNYRWNPLRIPNIVEETQAKLNQANVDIMYLDAGIIEKYQIQENLQANEQYQFEQERIDALKEIENSRDLEEDLDGMDPYNYNPPDMKNNPFAK